MTASDLPATIKELVRAEDDEDSLRDLSDNID